VGRRSTSKTSNHRHAILELRNCFEQCSIHANVHVPSSSALSSSWTRWLFIFALLAAACGFAIAVQALSWWHLGEADLSPIRSRNCFGQSCRSGGLSWVGASSLWMQSGVATFAAGLISAFICVVSAAALAAKRSPGLLANMMLVSGVTSIVVGSYFVGNMPLAGASLQPGIYVYVLSAVVTLMAVGFIHLRRRAISHQ
jgi:hypothetical protein